MAPRVYLALAGLSLAAGCSGAAALPTDGGGEGELVPARCPTVGVALAVAGATMPALEELARFTVPGSPSFAADDQNVYWVSYAAMGPPIGGGPTAIEGYSLRLGDSAPRPLGRQELDGNRSVNGRLWSSGPDLAWLEFFPSKPPTNGAIYTQPKAGGPAAILLDHLRVTDITGGLRLVGADEERLYLSPISPVGISVVMRTTGATTRHIATAAPPTLLALDGDQLYWVEGDALWRARRDAPVAQLVASGVPDADALAIHDGIAWLALDRLAPRRVARVDVRGPSATCTTLSPWPDGGRGAQMMADASGVYVALADISGADADTVWSIRADGTGTRRLLGLAEGRRVRLLAPRPDGLLLAASRPDGDGWVIARLPTP
jgi:hypothetical protein